MQNLITPKSLLIAFLSLMLFTQVGREVLFELISFTLLITSLGIITLVMMLAYEHFFTNKKSSK